MENLNAETVKRALEYCANNEECVGEECPYYAISCENNMPKDALALIKSQEQEIATLHASCTELTRKCASLEADVAKEFTCVFGQPHKVSDCPINDEIAKAKADTVRKMHSMLCEGRVSNDTVVIVSNQIAKEMLEGEK
ncbi:MAG: hypothetical protein J6J71_04860 [Prevotella sp.]|nr:hypothetical protein [Prevotella sp.]